VIDLKFMGSPVVYCKSGTARFGCALIRSGGDRSLPKKNFTRIRIVQKREKMGCCENE
jgi:hypothetical protein